MVMDKGMGPIETRDWLDVAADCVDYVKLGFGTSLLYPREVLRRKVADLVGMQIAVLPGGTLLEAAVVGDDVDGFFRFARAVGFTHVEVSDGTVALSARRRRDLILRAREAGFGVLTEVGKKDPTMPFHAARAAEQICRDLEAGAEKVIVEGRDSGRGSGVLDESGQLRDDLFDDLLAELGGAGGGKTGAGFAWGVPAAATSENDGGTGPSVADVIWEAPDTGQQLAILLRIGPEASFGNVRPQDVFTLEAMRRGLRSDTLRLRLAKGEAGLCDNI